MAEILSVIASALRADQNRLEQASVNATNAATPGFKRASIASVSFDSVMAAQESGAAHGNKTGWLAQTPVQQKIIDFTAGSLMQTGRTLDVAVEGKAFIAVTNGTRTWLTRTASLRVSTDGELVGPKGLRVVGHEGDIRPGSDQGLSIGSAGHVMSGEQAVGRIQLWETLPDVALNSDDGVLFEVAPDHIREAAVDTNVIRSGFLEGSNTNNLKEMLGVMESVRHFESLIRLAQGYDEALGRAIQKLGEV